jgi:hypothetical protein
LTRPGSAHPDLMSMGLTRLLQPCTSCPVIMHTLASRCPESAPINPTMIAPTWTTHPGDTLACSDRTRTTCPLDALSRFYTPAAPNSPRRTHCPPPPGTPPLRLPHCYHRCGTTRQLTTLTTARGTLAPVHKATIKCLHHTLGTGASIPGLWGQSMQQSTNFAEPRLLYPMSMGHTCLLLLM